MDYISCGGVAEAQGDSLAAFRLIIQQRNSRGAEDLRNNSLMSAAPLNKLPQLRDATAHRQRSFLKLEGKGWVLVCPTLRSLEEGD
jgi:hypothetical protein